MRKSYEIAIIKTNPDDPNFGINRLINQIYIRIV